ncbi:hypothetical protein G7Y79_00027g060130 [Physcia stellaris]|nr:hypothetical protein G7Y79_00027g060130 [Physcia stellaris]
MAPPQDDPRNPFESFRRFADEQMSSLMRSLTGQTANTPKSRASESPESDEDLPWIVRGMSEESRRRYREAQREMKDYISEQEIAAERSEAHENEQPRCPYRPADQEVPERNQVSSASPVQERMAEHGGWSTQAIPPDTVNDLGFHSPFTWLVDYLFSSTYSPLFLENHYQERGQKWRLAFEDLVAAQSGMDMEEHDSQQPRQCTVDWVNSMMNRGVFGARDINQTPFGTAGRVLGYTGATTTSPEETYSVIMRLLRARAQIEEQRRFEEEQEHEEACRGVARLLRAQAQHEQLKKFEDDEDDDDDDDEEDVDGEYDNYADEEESSDEREEFTELDLLERVLGLKGCLFDRDLLQSLASQAFNGESASEEASTPKIRNAENGKPSIISTLTTTERTTLPDGSVHTKMVLKKRFADGREESSETTHTTKDQQPPPQQKAIERPPASKVGKNDETDKSPQKTKGWFWS